MNSVMTREGTGRIMNMKIICDEGVWQRCMHVWGVCYGGMWGVCVSCLCIVGWWRWR